MTDESRVDLLARQLDLEVEPALVDNEAAIRSEFSALEAKQEEHRAELERRQREKEEQLEHAADVLPALRLADANLQRGREVKQTFLEAGPDGDEAERLLLELIAGEVPVILQLRDLEAATAALACRTMTDPTLSPGVLKVARETTAWLTAVRSRTEKTMVVIADLRAQRRFLAAHRRQSGD
jgi:hypothetical protein